MTTDRTGKTLTKDQATQLRERVRTVNKAVTASTVELAGLLYNVCFGTVRDAGGEDVDLVVTWGHDDFDEWAEHELGMHQTRARGLVVLYEELFVKQKFPDGALPDSVTKLRTLAKVGRKCRDLRQLKSWIAMSLEKSPCEFADAVDKEFGAGTSGSKFRRLGFSLRPGQFTALRKRIHAARDSFGVATDGEALIKIVDEWLTWHQSRDRVRRKRAS